MKLYSYFRSSASYRVRIALNLKNLDAEIIPVNLLKGEQKSTGYTKLNPQGLLPALMDDGNILTQSLAIIEYLEETHPDTPLLPKSPADRARVRALSLAIACEIAPINNLGTFNYLKNELEVSDEQKIKWIHHWIGKGFAALEIILNDGESGKFCHGDTPTMADCCLMPQVFNARRFDCDLTPYPKIIQIVENCEAHPAFIEAHPSKQADAA